MFGEIGIEKLLLLLGVVIIFFGPRRIPEIAGSLGKGIREFKKTMSGAPEPEPAVMPRPSAEPAAPPAAAEAVEPKRLLR